MRVLVIGAGALGQVFGLHLATAGCDVEYLVKPGRAGPLRAGMAVQRLGRGRGTRPRQLRPAGVYETLSEAAAQGGWEMVWLCVQSPSLAGGWTAELRDAADGSTVVSIGQQIDDLSTLSAVLPAGQIVQVVPSLFAFAAPDGQQGSPGSPGVEFWVPPGSVLSVAGAPERSTTVAEALRTAGLRAKAAPQRGRGEMAAAANTPFFTAAGLAGGSLRAAWPVFADASLAARQATRIVAARFGLKPPATAMTSAQGARAAFTLLSRLAPFDFAAYASAHVAKINTQTLDALNAWIREGQRRDMPTGALSHFRTYLSRHPSPQEAR